MTYITGGKTLFLLIFLIYVCAPKLCAQMRVSMQDYLLPMIAHVIHKYIRKRNILVMGSTPFFT